MHSRISLLQLFISHGHNYIGHHGGSAGSHRLEEVTRIDCIADRGIRGDRFFDHQQSFKGQITFFAMETCEALSRDFGICVISPGVFRRNVITRGVELRDLIGVKFELQGVYFLGTEECRPCYWMDQALRPGAEAALAGRGGLRARILTSGVLHAPAETVLNTFPIEQDCAVVHVPEQVTK